MRPSAGWVGAGPALANLRALLDVNEQMGSPACEARASRLVNEAARGLLLEAVWAARVHRDRLRAILRDWERAERARGTGPSLAPKPTETSTRDLVEGWVGIKESAEDLYLSLAEAAPTRDLARRMERLAREERDLAFRLRALL